MNGLGALITMLAAALIAAVIALTGHWQIATGGPESPYLYRLDRWIGDIEICFPSQPKPPWPKGRLPTVEQFFNIPPEPPALLKCWPNLKSIRTKIWTS